MCSLQGSCECAESSQSRARRIVCLVCVFYFVYCCFYTLLLSSLFFFTRTVFVLRFKHVVWLWFFTLSLCVCVLCFGWFCWWCLVCLLFVCLVACVFVRVRVWLFVCWCLELACWIAGLFVWHLPCNAHCSSNYPKFQRSVRLFVSLEIFFVCLKIMLLRFAM